ncbi:MAG: transcription-repair coupling factor [Clostridia bacterium]|nr:transcription-repair coupling factor [Clostridia bacterium]
MEAWWELFADWPEFAGLVQALRKGARELLGHGLPPAAQAAVLAALLRATGRPLLAIAPDWESARDTAELVSAWAGEESAWLLPPSDVLFHGVAAQGREAAAARVRALSRLRRGAVAAVAPVAAVLRRLPPPAAWDEATVELRVGARLEKDAFCEHLAGSGYDPRPEVDAVGTFAVRGGIVDVYPPDGPGPVRIELFDDEIDSLRVFDLEDQRSRREVEAVAIPPAREAFAPRARLLEAAEAVRREARALAEGGAGERVRAHAEALAEGLRAGRGGALEAGLPYLYDDLATIADYLGERGLVVLLEPARLEEEARAAEGLRQSFVADELAAGRALPRQVGALLGWEELKRRLAAQGVVLLAGLPRHPKDFHPQGSWSLVAQEVPPFHGQEALFTDEVRRYRESRYRVLVAAGGGERAERVLEALARAGVPCDGALDVKTPVVPPAGAVWVTPLAIRRGAVWPALRLVVIGEVDLAGPRAARRPRRRRPLGQPGARLESLADLAVGDYVVHVHHGIARYLGTRAMTVGGVRRDYLLLKYEGEDRLYVPTDQIDLVQRYVGGAANPRLSRLGGGEWQRTRQRVKESVTNMARELLALYAARQALPGHAFAPDTPWQAEFEDAFPWEETPDQLRAIAEVKADMEAPRPMDRVLCGDVGYGKTEVALRAAFKAVMDGRQVAVLVPTTILAEQHYLTFTERFRGFPVEIRMLSRFRSEAEQERTITGLRTGQVDVVIGTHRLVQGDVAFKNLGLLVVDEEHRFGVAAKERLVQLSRSVDVLTLTATPIPRTLHMAMSGLRDLSVIETPPANRYPVETYVVEMDDAVVRQAIERELARGGQVFYVHNRVRSIERARERLRRLVPAADVVVAHGQMPEAELERVMVEFLHGRHDVLLCTTIIESGLDMPNVNTLIVEDADRLGLAQLYQIRGRVGRSDRVAYAYFTFRPQKVLTEAAERRLAALKDFADLGSGLKVALRDLEIRGAGNILGPEQHGFVAQVGVHLYAQLLEEAVAELKGERRVPETRVSVELAVDAYLPEDYVAGARHKLEFYKKVNQVATLADADAIEAELGDRFGPPPEPVRNLVALSRLRVRAEALGALALTQEGRVVRLVFPGFMAERLDAAGALAARFRRRIGAERKPHPSLTLVLEDPRNPLPDVLAWTETLSQLDAFRSWRESFAQPAALGSADRG